MVAILKQITFVFPFQSLPEQTRPALPSNFLLRATDSSLLNGPCQLLVHSIHILSNDFDVNDDDDLIDFVVRQMDVGLAHRVYDSGSNLLIAFI